MHATWDVTTHQREMCGKASIKGAHGLKNESNERRIDCFLGPNIEHCSLQIVKEQT